MSSTKLIDTHFWLATIGVVIYIAAMWIAGVMQGLMWRATNPDGTLTYAFIDSIHASRPYFIMRLVGGGIYLTGMLLMAYNMARTMLAGQAYDAPIPDAVAHA